MKTARAFEVTLSIPDNEALTALATLQRLGIEVGDVRRADLWSLRVDEGKTGDVMRLLRSRETIYNPNKHRLKERAAVVPEPGEVWIGETAALDGGAGRVTAEARGLPGVERADRLTSWRLFDRHGNPAADEVVERAVETLLCNPSFQRAIR